MKVNFFRLTKSALVVLALALFFNTSSKAFTYTWTGANVPATTDWDVAGNWSSTDGGTTYPGPGDNVLIPISKPRYPILIAAKTITDFTISGGTLTLNGNNLTINGVASFSSSAINNTGSNALITINGATATFGGAFTFSTLIDITASCGSILLNGATFNGTVNLTKTGSTPSTGNGNNTFNGITTITNNGGGNFITANTTRDIFNNDLTLISTNGTIYMSHNGTNSTYNGNIYLSSTSTGIFFGNVNGTSTLATGKTISILPTGSFNSGTLKLARFTMTVNHTLVLGSTASTEATLNIGPASVFNGNVDYTAPHIFLNGGTFTGTATFTKSVNLKGGSTTDQSSGANIFQGITTINSVSAGYMLLGSASVRDKFLSDLYVNTQNGGFLYLSHTSAVATPTEFHGNVYVTSTAPGTGDVGGSGVYFGNGGGKSIFSATKNVLVGTGGFAKGPLQLSGFTIADPYALTLTGTATLTIGPALTFSNTADLIAPQLLLNGGTFNGVANITKNGPGNNTGNGGNIFNAVTTISTSASGYISTAILTRDIFINDLYLNSSNGGIVYVAHSSPATTFTEFHGNVYVTSTAPGTGDVGGSGVAIGGAGGKSVFSTNKKVIVGTGGFAKGTLQLGGFTVADPYSLTLAGTAMISIGPALTFSNTADLIAPQIILNGGTFNGVTNITKNGATFQNVSNGGNIFNAQTTLNSIANGYITLGLTLPDAFNADLILNTSNAGSIYLAYNHPVSASPGYTAFNGNVYVNAFSGGNNILFGNSIGLSRFATGKTVFVGSNGFSSGILQLKGVTMNADLNLTLTGAATAQLGPNSNFNGTTSCTSPNILLNGGKFLGAASFTKTDVAGAGTNGCLGGNEYFGPFTLNNLSSLAAINLCGSGSSNDIYHDDATFIKSSVGAIQLANFNWATFEKNVTYNSFNGAATNIANNGGRCVFTGANPQTLNGNVLLSIKNLYVDKTSGNLTLNTPVSILATGTLNLTKGNIISSSTNPITINSGAIINGGTIQSFVDGPLKKAGTVAFTFPVGKGSVFAPINIGIPSVNTTITAEYFNTAPSNSGNISLPLRDISDCEYWNISSSATSSFPVSLNWGSYTCSLINYNVIAAARYVGSNWQNEGSNSVTSNYLAGSVTSTSSSFTLNVNYPMTFGYKSKIVVNTTGVNASNFTITGADYFANPLVSGSAGTKSGILTIHPTLPVSGTLDVILSIQAAANNSNKALNVKLEIDDQSVINKVYADAEGSYLDMSPDYHSITGSGRIVSFYNEKPVSSLNITTNLQNGIDFILSQQPKFIVTTPGFTNAVNKLRIIDPSNNVVYYNNPLEWDGKISGVNGPEGNYKFELELVSSGNTYTYKGQLILKH